MINLHAGPGSYSGIGIKIMGSGLEDKFLVAYLDQRGCGKSLACSDTARLNVEHYIHDLDIVIEDDQHHKYLFYKGKLTLYFYSHLTEQTLLQNMGFSIRMVILIPQEFAETGLWQTNVLSTGFRWNIKSITKSGY